MNKRQANFILKAWANPGEFSGWQDISINPPINIPVLIYIKNWGAAIGRLLGDNSTFRCSLPHEKDPPSFYIGRQNISYWAVIPTLKEPE